MKKWLSILLVLALVLCMGACDGEETVHNYTHHLHGTLTPEQAGKFQSAILRVFVRTGDQVYAPLTQKEADFQEGALCVNWDEKFISGPDNTAAAIHPVAGSPEEYYMDGILWDFDTMNSVACTWHISLASGKAEVVGCYESSAWGKELDWTAYDQTNYKFFGYSPQWSDAGILLPVEKWSQDGFIGVSEDDLSNGIDLKFTSMNEDMEYFYNFEVTLTDGTTFCTELAALVHEQH